jgi:glycosyltransferase involved in cell wall biosynthesis
MTPYGGCSEGETLTGAATALSVAALVDLEFSENAGGHVKCWQRIGEAAAEIGGGLDFTAYFLGTRERIIELGGNARLITLPPVLGTRRFGFLAQGGGHTDLAPYHPYLARLLRRHDVIHTTDVFAFAQTGRRVANWHGKPHVTSIHTDLPLFTEIYTAEIVRRLIGNEALSCLVLDTLRVGARNADRMRRKVDRMIHSSDRVLVSNPADWRYAAGLVGTSRVAFLRRGIDSTRFHPSRRDRARLAARFGIPEDCPVLLFVGRVDATKNVRFAAEIARSLVDTGHRLRFLVVGDGAERRTVTDLLGPDAVTPGHLSQEELGWICPSADVFVFPSRTETAGNVVLEAMASGLPVAVADHPGPAQFIARPGQDGLVLPTAKPAAWRSAIAQLISDAGARRLMGGMARQTIETRWPSWRDVVANDLLPIWRDAAPRTAASDPADLGETAYFRSTS